MRKWHLNRCVLIGKKYDFLYKYIKLLAILCCGPGPDQDVVLSEPRPITQKLLRIITFKYILSLYSIGLATHRNPQTDFLYIIPREAI